MEQNGRVSIPSEFLDDTDDQLILLPQANATIGVWNKAGWEQQFGALMQTPQRDVVGMREKRRLLTSARTVRVDAEQGRMTIPTDFSNRIPKDAGEVVFVGMYDHFEIWYAQDWDKYANEF